MSEPIVAPEPGQAVKINVFDRLAVGTKAIGDLMNFDLAANIDASYFVTDHFCSFPGIIIGGDLHIQGNTSSAKLASARVPPIRDSRFYVVVLGDLVVDGDLELLRYNSLLVTGKVKARAIYGTASNLVGLQSVVASELIAIDDGDERCRVYAKSMEAPLVVRIGCQTDWPFSIDGSIAYDVNDVDLAALRYALGVIVPTQPTNGPSHRYGALAAIIKAGQTTLFTRTYLAAYWGVCWQNALQPSLR
jgi:hypothetical protein